MWEWNVVIVLEANSRKDLFISLEFKIKGDALKNQKLHLTWFVFVCSS